MSELLNPNSINDFMATSMGTLNLVEIRRIFLMLIRHHYTTASHFTETGLECLQEYVWNEDPKLRRLEIELDFMYKEKSVDHKPAIYVGLGALQFEKSVVGDYAARSDDNSEIHETQIGKFPLIIRHIGQSPDISSLLASETLNAMMGMRKALMSQHCRVLRMDPVQVTAPQIFDPKNDEELRSDTIFNIVYEFGWKQLLEGHRIKTIVFRSSSDIRADEQAFELLSK